MGLAIPWGSLPGAFTIRPFTVVKITVSYKLECLCNFDNFQPSLIFADKPEAVFLFMCDPSMNEL
jgi:hypothetical protein